jgi:uncharacterized protein
MVVLERTSGLGGVTVERDVAAVMRDGTTLRADVYRPEAPGEYPVLLQRTPYNKVIAQNICFQHPAWYVRRGYIVVVQDTRGRFASDGEFNPYHLEAEDGADTVRWAANLPGANGRVATYGFSYPGVIQLLTAAERAPELACCAPGFTGDDFYEDWTYVGGAFNHAFVVSWVIQLLAIADALKRGDRVAAGAVAAQANDFPALYWAQPLRELPLLKEHGLTPYFFDWLDHDTRDEYWQKLSLRSRYSRIATPCLHYGGWYDSFIEGTLRNFVAMSELAGEDRARAQKLVIGPWFHIPWARLNGVRDFSAEADNVVDQLQVRWFDHWLKGKGDVLDEPRVRLFTMGENRWHDADAWPPAQARVQEWYLQSSGRALSISGDGALAREAPADEPPDVFVYTPQLPVPSAGGRSCCLPWVVPMGAHDQGAVEIRNDVLVYSTPPLEEAIEVTGTVELVLYAATDARDTDWTAKLVDVDEHGNAVNLCDGILRARFRDSLERATPIEPDVVYEYRIRIGSTSNLFKRGHRVRLEVSSSNFPHFDINLNNGMRVGEGTLLDAPPATQAVFHDANRASRLLLPVVPR